MRYAMNTLCIRRFAQTAALIAILGLSACSAMKNGFEPERADYRKTQSSPALVIPADLRPVVPESDQRLQAPSATFGPLNRKGSTPALSNLTVDCTREPCQLPARATPEQLWPHLREFWLQLGFTLAQDRPDLGLIETDWAENRARFPMTGCARSLEDSRIGSIPQERGISSGCGWNADRTMQPSFQSPIAAWKRPPLAAHRNRPAGRRGRASQPWSVCC